MKQRPALRYHGGKWRLAPWIVSHFPPHRVFVDAYGGGGSIILRKTRSYAEIYDDMLINWQRVDRRTCGDGRSERVESLWLSPAAFNRPKQATLF